MALKVIHMFMLLWTVTPLAVKDLCQNFGEDREIKVKGVSKKVNFKAIFDSQDVEISGEGAFGAVCPMNFPIENSEKIVIKYITSDEGLESKFNPPQDEDEYIHERNLQYIINEIDILKFLNQNAPGICPKFYFCEHTDDEVYIAQEMFYKDLEDEEIRDILLGLRPSEFVTKMKILFEGVIKMNSLKITHNDIKPANIMTDREFKKLVFVDFGTSQNKIEPINKAMTVGFSSPKKYGTRTNVELRDDLYSLAITVMRLNLFGKLSLLFREIDPKELTESQKNIFTGLEPSLASKDRETKTVLKNTLFYLMRRNLGGFQLNPNENTINFTMLIYEIIWYENFNRSGAQILAILDRIIAELEKQEERSYVLKHFSGQESKIKAMLGYDYNRKVDGMRDEEYDSWVIKIQKIKTRESKDADKPLTRIIEELETRRSKKEKFWETKYQEKEGVANFVI